MQTAEEEGAAAATAESSPGVHPLDGVRVVESGDATIDFCGQILAGMGAEVLKVEPPGGAEGRRIGPFLDRAAPGTVELGGPGQGGPGQGGHAGGATATSLFHWTYNRGKGSIVVDPASAADRERLWALAADADVWIHAGHPTLDPAFCGLGAGELRSRFPRLVTARLTPFGESGPWAGYRGSDLVQLALGGVLMNCGYDPGLDGRYDTAPAWPQAFQSLHIAGEQLSMAVVAALVWRAGSGEGQALTCALHEAVAKCTEVDLMSWVMLRTPFHRQTCRHSGPDPSAPTIAATKDGRWMAAMTMSGVDRRKLREHLAGLGVGTVDEDPGAAAATARNVPGTGRSLTEDSQRDIELVQRLTRRALYRDLPWKEGQEAGLLWSPVRKPHENALDPHWLRRGTFADVDHGDGVTIRYPVSKWRSTSSSWKVGDAAPALGDDRGLPDRWRSSRPTPTPAAAPSPAAAARRPSGREPEPAPSPGKGPWALDGIRVVDFSWFLASAGGTRFLAAMGADCIKIEWSAHPDTRLGAGAPEGGRAARDRATGPLTPINDPDMGGNFNHKNAGKRGISLNVRHPEGLRILKELVKQSDVVAEGFSPGVMARWGLGYDVLEELRPGIIYAQQSGMGAWGEYGRTRAVGPIAAALAGVTEMSGQPDPAPPAGWGYSYLDWLAAYSFATAILGALYERATTGRGQYIDASQCEVGIYASALAIADWSANGRAWERTGNRSPYLPAAPEGVFRCRGEDRWLAVTCAGDDQWRALATVLGQPALASDSRFATLAGRLRHRDVVDGLVARWAEEREPYEAMDALQAAGVAAGVCQTAEDRCDHDPQLAHLGWLTEVTGTRIGTWPVGEVAVRMDGTPPSIGGRIGRGAPGYGEDNYAVYGELLGLSEKEVDRLREEGVV